MYKKYSSYFIALFITGVLTLILTACQAATTTANPGTPGKNGNSAAGALPTQTVTSTIQSNATSTPTTKSPIIATSTPVTSTPTITSTNEVKVNMTDAAITSSRQSFSVNVPYTFLISNQGKSPHDFVITQQAQNPVATPTTQPALIIIPATQLPAGATRLLTYTFPANSTTLRLVFTENLQGAGGTQGGAPQFPIQVK